MRRDVSNAAIRYIRDSFFAAREFTDLADLNAQAHGSGATRSRPSACVPKIARGACARCSPTSSRRLLALPDNPFPAEEREETDGAAHPVRALRLNDYSVPYTYVRRPVVVHATLEYVRIVDGRSVIATHPRSWDKGEVVEIEEHVRGIWSPGNAPPATTADSTASIMPPRTPRPSSPPWPNAAAILARRLPGSLGCSISTVPAALDQALAQALAANAAHLPAVRQILDQHQQARHQEPPRGRGAAR